MSFTFAPFFTCIKYDITKVTACSTKPYGKGFATSKS